MNYRPTKRAIVSIVVSVVVVALVVAAMVFAVTRDTGGSDALTVNGRSVSQGTINRELDGWVASGLANSNGSISNSDGSVTAGFSAIWLTNRVGAIAIEKLMREHRVSITTKERTAALEAQPKAFGELPETGQDSYITVLLGSTKLAAKLGGGDVSSKAIAREMRKFDVSVDPKYGRWVPARVQVCPVTGCPAASAQASAGG
jgi:hypothetical protein